MLVSHTIVKIITFIVDSHSENKKFIRKYFHYLRKTIDQLNRDHQIVNISQFELEILDNFIEVELPPGAYELVDINNIVKQILSESKFNTLTFGIDANTKSMKSVSTISNNTFKVRIK